MDRGISEATAREEYLGFVEHPLPGHERFQGMLVIPYLTPTGPAKLKFRCIASHDCKEHGHPKYDQEAGAGTFLYGVKDFGLDPESMCITEGEIDRLSCVEAGIPAVGVDGATKWLSHWAYCFEGIDELIVLQDGDDAGKKLSSSVMNNTTNARVIRMPDGQDVNSLLVQGGPEALRSLVLSKEEE